MAEPANPRHVLLAVDDTDASQIMFNWVLDNELQPEDKVHLLHVMIRDVSSHESGDLPGGDYFEQAHPHEAQLVVMKMLQQRYLHDLEQLGIKPIVHLVQASQDPSTVGRIICSKAEQLHCQRVYLAGQAHHHTSKLVHLLSGPSVSEYCKQHCKVPLTVVIQAGPGSKEAIPETVQPA